MTTWTLDAAGTVPADGTEQVLHAQNPAATYVLAVDLNALANGDRVEIRVYDKIDGTNYRLVWNRSFAHTQSNPGKLSPPLAVTGFAKWTLKQVAGTNRSFPWQIRRLGGYIGPGDIVPSGWDVWGGLRGFSAAYSAPGTNPAIDISMSNSSIVNGATIKILPNGLLDVGAVALWKIANSASNIYISKVYDQCGQGKHFDSIVGGSGIYPELLLNDNGSLPAIKLIRSVFPWPDLVTTVNSSDLIHPFAFSTVAARTGSFGVVSPVTQWGNAGLNFDSTPNQIQFGSGSTAAATDNVTHALNGIIEWGGPNATVSVDGTVTTPASNLFETSINKGHIGGGTDGKVWEVGWCAGDISPYFMALNANQHLAWNF